MGFPLSLNKISLFSKSGKLPYPISETYDDISGTTFLPGVLAFSPNSIFFSLVLPIVKKPSNLLFVMFGPG